MYPIPHKAHNLLVKSKLPKAKHKSAIKNHISPSFLANYPVPIGLSKIIIRLNFICSIFIIVLLTWILICPISHNNVFSDQRQIKDLVIKKRLFSCPRTIQPPS